MHKSCFEPKKVIFNMPYALMFKTWYSYDAVKR